MNQAIVGIHAASDYPDYQYLPNESQPLSLFEELKRRNVFKVAIAYIVAAWVMLQVADVILGNIAAPAWVFQVLLFFLFAGFPFALMLAWAFELTPAGLKREQEVESDAALIASARRAESENSSGAADKTAEMDRSIAVLPFVNMSDDASNEYFSDGISEELMNLLAKIPELRVAARTSSFSLKNKDLQISEVGEILNVAHVLEGSVRKSDNRLRITAQLIQTADGFQLWSETYNHTLDDIFATQEEIAGAVVAQLKITLLGRAPEVKEADPNAYPLFLQARYLASQGTASAFEQAIALYQQALDIAPDYAAAWAGLSDAYRKQTQRGLRQYEEGFSLAREAAEKALAIDPRNAKAHASLGWLALAVDGDLALAAGHFERALELEPTNPDMLSYAAFLVMLLGRQDEAIALMEYVVARDPVNADSHHQLAKQYLWAGRLDDVIAALDIALKVSPGRISANWAMGVALLLKGENEAALKAMQQEDDEDAGWRLAGLILVYHALGQKAESDAALAEMISTQEQIAAYNIAYILAFRGEADRAFEWLDKAVHYKDPGLIELTVQPLFANIHADPRWVPFLEKIGMSPTQLNAIEFEVTLPE